MTDWFLGVDAGNSKTIALVGDERGTILGWGRSGVGDIYGAAGKGTAVSNVLAAIDAALLQAGLREVVEHGDYPLRAAAFCLAGVDWPEDRSFWCDRLTGRYPFLRRYAVRNDGFATLRSGQDRGTGIAVVVGTGPSVVARATTGEESCLGWWCFDHLGGSGLGADGLRAVYQAHQGLAGPTVLTERLGTLYGIAEVPDLLHAFTRRNNPLAPAERNRAARVVLRAAADGDRVALRIVDGQAEAFAGYAWWVGRQAGLDVGGGGGGGGGGVRSRVAGSGDGENRGEGIEVVIGGSVALSEIPVLRELLKKRLAERIPHAVITTAAVPADVGALLEALAEGGVPQTPQVRDRFGRADLPPTLFDTD